MTGARIIGYGTALPDRILTNAELATMVDTSDEWITDRTGIKERRIGGTTAGLATEAAKEAIKAAGVSAADIDLLILATTTPDRAVPATASTVQELVGLRCGAFDLNAACSGFVYALVAAHGFVSQGLERVLVIGAETLSKITDWDDRGTCILFADGAGAVVVERTEGAGSLLGWHLDSDGSAEEVLYGRCSAALSSSWNTPLARRWTALG
jgi:3-oxoacyl-[acyl-carrier-protein] synthase-3